MKKPLEGLPRPWSYQSDATQTTTGKTFNNIMSTYTTQLTVSLWDDRFCRGTQNNVTLKPFRYRCVDRHRRTKTEKFSDHSGIGTLNKSFWTTHQNNVNNKIKLVWKQNAIASQNKTETRIPPQTTCNCGLRQRRDGARIRDSGVFAIRVTTESGWNTNGGS